MIKGKEGASDGNVGESDAFADKERLMQEMIVQNLKNYSVVKITFNIAHTLS